MKKLLLVSIAALLLVSCSRNVYQDRLKFYLNEFGETMNDLNTSIAGLVGDPEFEGHKDLRSQAMLAWQIIGKMKDLEPPKNMEDSHRILTCAYGQYERFFVEVIHASYYWEDDCLAHLNVLSRDASVTLNTYLARSSFLLAETR